MPKIIKELTGRYVFCNVPNVHEKTIYLTFDDGPTENITQWILEKLNHYDIKATFFCIGKNVKELPNIYQKILDNNHATGNHTNNHLNGFKTPFKLYHENIKEAEQVIKSSLFRPPYGRIKPTYSYRIRKEYSIILWSLLSMDYKQNLNTQKSLDLLTKNLEPGSIIVFHDSLKAENNMKIMLPQFIEYALKNDFKFEILKHEIFNPN